MRRDDCARDPREAEGILTSAAILTVRLAGRWTSRCKACGDLVSWRKTLDGGLAKFNVDPIPIRLYCDPVTKSPVVDLDAADLHERTCDPQHRPRPLFDGAELM